MTAAPTIRTFELADLDAASRLWEAAEGMAVPSRDEVERKLERDPQLFVVAEDAGEVVGVAMGTYDGRRGYVFRLAVAPSRQRQGIGAALVGELERRFRDMGVTRIRVLVFGSNRAARSFWEGLGYSAAPDVVLYSKEQQIRERGRDHG